MGCHALVQGSGDRCTFPTIHWHLALPSPGSASPDSLKRPLPLLLVGLVCHLPYAGCGQMEKPLTLSQSQMILLCRTQKCVNAQRARPCFGLSNTRSFLALGSTWGAEQACECSRPWPIDLSQPTQQRSKPSQHQISGQRGSVPLKSGVCVWGRVSHGMSVSGAGD